MAGRDVSLKNQYFGLPAVPVLALLGSIVPLLYSANFASVEPVLDAWAWIAHLRSLSLGEEALLQIPFIQHNEHPLAFPTLVFLTFGRIFNYRLDAVALLHSVFIFLTSLTLLRLARLSGVKFLLPLALAALLLGSLRQCENLILGFNISITAAVVSGALSIYFLRACLDRPKPGFPTVSALCAVACALACLTSNASAVALFPATLVTLGLTPRRDRFAAAYAAGTLAAAAGWYALFFPRGPFAAVGPDRQHRAFEHGRRLPGIDRFGADDRLEPEHLDRLGSPGCQSGLQPDVSQAEHGTPLPRGDRSVQPDGHAHHRRCPGDSRKPRTVTILFVLAALCRRHPAPRVGRAGGSRTLGQTWGWAWPRRRWSPSLSSSR